ncbi:MAG TPA: hypothetical protein VNJ54_03640 [Plantibacter sp.]|uniref:hypothetical protein n=1 Tax=unclassified Plantibacter TaxID=2624265 RepID=UPI002C0B17D2|nr:hypothetical protein [Plantibacter sp.]
MSDAPPSQLLVGPATHGVVQYAADVAAEVEAADERATTIRATDPAAALIEMQRLERAHVHVTDRLFGRTPEEAAVAVEALAASTSLTITLHDVPQSSDGRMLARRIEAYGRCIAAARASVVNSEHEQDLVREFIPNARVPQAITLGARTGAVRARDGATEDDPSDPSDASPRDLVVLIGGYIYPGKGHTEVIAAAAAAAETLRGAGAPLGRVVVQAIGGPSQGHEQDVDVLVSLAAQSGVELQVTGYLDDAAFVGRVRADGIPVAAHSHVSASRSMLDWVENGRRPLVVDSRYAGEMEALRPGTLLRYEPAALADRLVDAWHDPGLTRLQSGLSLRPTIRDAAGAYLEWWRTTPDPCGRTSR